MTEVLDKCSFCDKHLTVERLKNEKAEMTNSRERLYQEYLVLQSQLTEAKEIIREYSNLKNFPCASGNSINMLMYENIKKKAEAFLKE